MFDENRYRPEIGGERGELLRRNRNALVLVRARFEKLGPPGNRGAIGGFHEINHHYNRWKFVYMSTIDFQCTLASMRVGLLGCGGMGTVHARQYAKMADVELAIYDRNPERLAALGTSTSAHIVGSRDELLAWAEVIDVCLPTDLHADACLAAIAAGRAVFCEKPVALDLDSAVAIVSAADKANVPFMPGQVVRFFPEFARGHRMVKDGAVGNPAVARTRRGGRAPQGSEGWFLDPKRSGGVLLDLAIHDFDWLRWSLGEVIQVRSRKTGTGDGPEYALTILTFESGCLGHVEATWMDPGGFRTTFEVAGSGGLIEYDSRSAPSVRVTTMDSTSAENPWADTDDPYYQELRQFLDAVSQGTTPPVTGLDGLHALAIAVAANESAETDRTVRPASQF